MKILITGGAGFIGTLLARTLLERGTLCGTRIESLVVTDLYPAVHPALKGDSRVRNETGDLIERLDGLMSTDYDAIFHLASAVSGECETDFELGLRSNVDATRFMLEALRAQQARTGKSPLFFFASSVAVYGSDDAISLPDVVCDETLPTPQSSYGIHKFICEQLVADYSRKGFIDGRAARLMTVSVRPGKPNGAASGFLSGIVREPLAGIDAICPVDPSTAIAIASPITTIEGILKVTEASREDFGGRTAINLPGLTVTVQQMLEALARTAGQAVLERVRVVPDAQITRIVSAWPSRFQSARAVRLGLRADHSFDEIIAQYRALA